MFHAGCISVNSNDHFNLQLIKSGCEWLVLHIYSRFQEPIKATVPVKINVSWRVNILTSKLP